VIIILSALSWGSTGLVLFLLAALLWCQAGLKAVALAFRSQTPDRHPYIIPKDPTVWPHYTVLVPLYDEAESVPALMKALSHLDYPADRLEIFMICEADDARTQAAIKERLGGLYKDSPFHLISVPAGGPRTKPNALRVAMRQARGDIVTIYDAEDAPHPGQLKAAVRTFASDARLVALQAPLVVDNVAPAWITRQFALEYAALFYIWVPWLCRAGLTVPLGGTSNHIRREALDRAGGWDPYNVTEDADLSFRLALQPGARFGWLDHPTSEEAVPTIRAWVGQRTRWIKGFLQTWIMHMRAPLSPGGWTGMGRFLALQITLGLTLLTSLFHVPAVIGVALAWSLGHPPSPLILALGGTFYLSGIVGALIGARRAGLRPSPVDMLTIPLYWALLTLPAWLAVIEIIHRPHYWNKTQHGVSARAAPSLGEVI
jgi:cellulose synthase/poly-beta-1,6-N-acetylglucosamine synthase-like glycosyltransferase